MRARKLIEVGGISISTYQSPPPQPGTAYVNTAAYQVRPEQPIPFRDRLKMSRKKVQIINPGTPMPLDWAANFAQSAPAWT